MTATRRLWARRMLRAGWLLAPILGLPNKIYKCLFGTFDAACATIFLTVIVSIVGGVTYSKMKEEEKREEQLRIANPADIERFLTKNDAANNWCMQEILPKWAAGLPAPLTIENLEATLANCKKANSVANIRRDQQSAMTKFIPKPAEVKADARR